MTNKKFKITLPAELKEKLEQNKDKIDAKIPDTVKNVQKIDPSVYYEIKDENCILTATVKTIINESNINIDSLNFDSRRDFYNYKGSLQNRNSMRVDRFENWMYLLDVQWKIVYGKELEEFEKWKANRDEFQAWLEEKNQK